MKILDIISLANNPVGRRAKIVRPLWGSYPKIGQIGKIIEIKKEAITNNILYIVKFRTKEVVGCYTDEIEIL